jgi:azurin
MLKSILVMLALVIGGVPAVAAGPTKVAITTKGSEIAFDKTKLSAKKGSVEITFTNKASPDADMPHNFVLLKPGSSVDDVAALAIAAGPGKNYIPESPALIKGTALLNAGQKDTITVDLEPGAYPYFCSYPGHASLMKGILTVK